MTNNLETEFCLSFALLAVQS